MSNDWHSILTCDIVVMRGADSLELLHRLSTNALDDMVAMECRQTLLTTNQGKLVDWLRVIRRDELVLVCSPGRGQRVADWLESYTIMEDVTSALAQARAPFVRWSGVDASHWMESNGVREDRAVAIDDGVAVCSPKGFSHSADIVSLDATGSVFDHVPIRDTQRLNREQYEEARVLAGVPSSEYEFKLDINPLELRLADVAISFSKGCYVGQEVLSRMESYDKVARTLIGWSSQDAVDPTDKSRIVVDGKSVGRVTSFVRDGATLYGLAIVNRGAARGIDAVLRNDSRESPIELTDRPFWA